MTYEKCNYDETGAVAKRLAFFFGRRENYPITPAGVERQAVSDFY